MFDYLHENGKKLFSKYLFYGKMKKKILNLTAHQIQVTTTK